MRKQLIKALLHFVLVEKEMDLQLKRLDFKQCISYTQALDKGTTLLQETTQIELK